MSRLGPTSAPEKLAARRLVAPFDRAVPRDLVDVFRLVRRWDRDEPMSLAGATDPGFDATILAIAMRQLDRYRNDDSRLVAPSLRMLG